MKENEKITKSNLYYKKTKNTTLKIQPRLKTFFGNQNSRKKHTIVYTVRINSYTQSNGVCDKQKNL